MEGAASSSVSDLLVRVADGDEQAQATLLPILYEELHGMAHRLMADQRRGHTLQTTALLHEAWMRLAGARNDVQPTRRHFLRLAVQAMRSVLVDHARRRNAKKRQGGRARPILEEPVAPWGGDPDEILALDDALSRLGERDEEMLRVVELRFFGGLTAAEAGEVLGLTERQVLKRWTFARGWLRRELSRGERRG